MILTIGMIVKNEEKYLEQCLTGIKPILDNVDSELIIADTGSTDRTVEIAKKFTDNVFYFEWINDFAAARNSTLEKAKGEWYMFVDGDEVFQSCDEIIKFFNSGDYKKYNSASFNIRNFLSEQLDTYADFNGPRLTKLLPHTKFVGEIHEALSTYGAPFKKLKDTALHYGYVYNDDNSYDEKFKRNSEALLKKYDELKGTDQIDERLYSQLYDCFINPDPERAEKFMQEGIALCKERNSPVLITLYTSRIFTAYCNAQFEELLEYADEYFSMDKAIRRGELSSDAEILALKGFALYNINRYDEAIEVFVKYFDVFKRVQNGKLVTYDSFLGTTQLATEKNFVQILNAFCRCCSLSGKYNLAAGYLQTMPIAKYSTVKEYIELLIVFEMELLEHFSYEDAHKYYKQLDPAGQKLFVEYLRNRLYWYDDKSKIINAMTDVSKGNDALSAKLKIYNKYFFSGDISEDELYSYAKKYGVNNDPDLFYIAMDKQYDISPLFNIKELDMKLCVYMCFMRMYGFHKVSENYDIRCVLDVNFLPLLAKFYEYIMKAVPIYRCPKPGVFLNLNIENLFRVYAQIGNRYISECKNDYNDIPPEIRSAAFAGEIIDAREQKNFKECFAAMKKAIITYNGIAAVIDEYQKLVSTEYEEYMKNEPLTEMQRLIKEFKKNINHYIVSGDFVSAKKALDQYKQINPDDPELNEFYRRIGSVQLA